MNTKEAVKKYGLWAVVSAVATHDRHRVDETRPHSRWFHKALQGTQNILNSDDYDGQYVPEIESMVRLRHKLRSNRDE